MCYQHHTRRDLSFDQWLAACSEWWDLTRGDETYDYPEFEWRTWYEQGLTVEAAVERANKQLYG